MGWETKEFTSPRQPSPRDATNLYQGNHGNALVQLTNHICAALDTASNDTTSNDTVSNVGFEAHAAFLATTLKKSSS